MVASAGIIIIGDEILSGRTKDTNINWIACELDNLGIRLKEARIIPDDSSTIIKQFKILQINIHMFFLVVELVQLMMI